MLIGFTVRGGTAHARGARLHQHTSTVHSVQERPVLQEKRAEEEIKRREKSAEWWKTKFKSFLLPVGSGRVTWLQDAPGGGRRSPLRQWRAAREGIGEEAGDAAVPGELASHLSRNSSAERR